MNKVFLNLPCEDYKGISRSVNSCIGERKRKQEKEGQKREQRKRGKVKLRRKRKGRQ